MLQYRRWHKPMVYKKVDRIGEEPKPYVIQVNCDGWYLFGKLPIITRENI